MPVAMAGDITVATQNLWRFLDDVKDGPAMTVSQQHYRLRLDKLSRQVVDVLRHPDVLAVQEAENAHVLEQLAAAIAERSGRPPYQVLLYKGRDRGGINSGFLLRADWQVKSMEPLLATRRLDRAVLFDRPPLLLTVETPDGRRLEIVNVHLKSLRGSEEPSEARRIARKRQHQSEALAGWMEQYLALNPAAPLMVLGDFNATPDALGGVDILGRLAQAGLSGALQKLPADQRYSYVHDCKRQALDHGLLAPALAARLRAAAYSRGNAGLSGRHAQTPGTAKRSSDHDGLVLYLREK